jgi:eukaryotic-like serine/threonine-protein kinase
MKAPQRIDRKTFLAHLRHSGLVPEPQLARALRALPETSRARPLARALVGRGLLTRFQAERLLAGRTAGFLLGQYRILDQVGRGGMGRVYKAEHRTMRRTVALKVLSPGVLGNDRAVELFLHEVRAVAQLVHPNVVTAYDANEVDGKYFLVLEFVDGPNLNQLVRRQGPLPVGLACDYARQVAGALQAAHGLGMVHRDVKPSNLLVQWRGAPGASSPGLVKVSDFGLARLHDPARADADDSAPPTILTRANTVMGTPDYLSPEQSRDLHATDIRSDLYSLGCTLYFLLTGSVPFPGGTALDKLVRHCTESPAPVGSLRPDAPPGVVAIVERLMAKDPAERFQTPAELAEALAPFAVSGPTPWAPSRAGGEEGPETPADNVPVDSGADLPLAPDSGELAALGDTVPEAGRTIGPPLSRVLTRLDAQARQRRLRSAFLWAFGITGALLGAAAALAMVLK